MNNKKFTLQRSQPELTESITDAHDATTSTAPQTDDNPTTDAVNATPDDVTPSTGAPTDEPTDFEAEYKELLNTMEQERIESKRTASFDKLENHVRTQMTTAEYSKAQIDLFFKFTDVTTFVLDDGTIKNKAFDEIPKLLREYAEVVSPKDWSYPEGFYPYADASMMNGTRQAPKSQSNSDYGRQLAKDLRKKRK